MTIPAQGRALIGETTAKRQLVRHISPDRITAGKRETSALSISRAPSVKPTLPFLQPEFGHNFSDVRVLPQAAHATPRTSPDSVGIGTIQPGGEAAVPGSTAETASSRKPGAEANAAASDACAITGWTEFKAPNGTASTRWIVGICEPVQFQIGPIRVADWQATSGSFEPDANKSKNVFKWKAPEEPGLCKITATTLFPKQTCDYFVDVIAPSAISMLKLGEVRYPPSSAGAGMQLAVIFRPLHVSFGNLKYKEENGPATNIKGYFEEFPFTATQLAHSVADPNFVPLRANNIVEKPDYAATNEGKLPPPWKKGEYHWDIPCQYSSVTGEAHQFPNTHQGFFIDETGTVTVTKQEASVTRSP